MKHGPIALLDERTPVVCVATDSPVLEKLVSNMQEVRARGAHVIAVATDGDDEIVAHAEEVLWVPRTDWMLQPLLAVIPLQLLAYRIATAARAERRSAAQPREDRHRRVALRVQRASSTTVRRPPPPSATREARQRRVRAQTVHSAPKATEATRRATLTVVPSSARPLPRSVSGTTALPSAISTPSVAA